MPPPPDRQALIERLVHHYQHPRHKGVLEGADAVMPGGNPGCGDLVTMYVRTEPGSDRIDCGPGNDIAYVDPSDRVLDCEDRR